MKKRYTWQQVSGSLAVFSFTALKNIRLAA